MLPLLNFLNLICAYRKEKNSFIEMFFEGGKSITDFKSWSNNRYLYGTLNNPYQVRCMLLVENEKYSTRFKYKRCKGN